MTKEELIKRLYHEGTTRKSITKLIDFYFSTQPVVDITHVLRFAEFVQDKTIKLQTGYIIRGKVTTERMTIEQVYEKFINPAQR
jgi:hypothetical protein